MEKNIKNKNKFIRPSHIEAGLAGGNLKRIYEARPDVIQAIIRIEDKQRVECYPLYFLNNTLRDLERRRKICKLSSSIEKLDEKIEPLKARCAQLEAKRERYDKAILRLKEHFDVEECDDDFDEIYYDTFELKEERYEALEGILYMKAQMECREFEV